MIDYIEECIGNFLLQPSKPPHLKQYNIFFGDFQHQEHYAEKRCYVTYLRNMPRLRFRVFYVEILENDKNRYYRYYEQAYTKWDMICPLCGEKTKTFTALKIHLGEFHSHLFSLEFEVLVGFITYLQKFRMMVQVNILSQYAKPISLYQMQVPFYQV